MKLQRIIDCMEKIAPSETALAWDNVGLMIGDSQQEIRNVLLALDVTDEVVNEAVGIGADLIISHHPLIFKPVSRITSTSNLGARIMRLIQNGIAVYSSHTNLDASEQGTNSALFDMLGLTGREILCDSEKYGRIGYTGDLTEETTLEEFAKKVKSLLSLDGIRYVGDGGRRVSKVGLCTGDSSDMEFIISAVQKGCDCYITGDMKYHNSQYALEAGLGLIDATHYATEVLVLKNIKEYLSGECGGLALTVSRVDGQVFKTV